MSLNKILSTVAVFLVTLLSGGAAVLADGIYKAKPDQLGFMEPATEVMRDIVSFHNGLLIMCIAITLFVMFVMIYIFIKFNAKANPIPSKTTHHTGLEVVWTILPIVILLIIAVPSFRLLYLTDVIPEADLTVKAIGHQWYWSYEYPDHDDFSFDATMLSDEEAAAAGHPRLLGTDTHMVVPVNKTVRMIITAGDVIHAWAIPAFGVKIDAVPGKLNETWFKAEREGMYYGQCSELCGKDHGFMPIMVEVVSEEKYNAWIAMAREEYATNKTDNLTRVAMLPAQQ
ncbi:MAG: cytochrome c oxidase subunit II [Alphaproteobacteria bacterium]|nr:MAG: cytochrome c oxidase subunit II [Alphaproteobacteria bacterium]